MRTRDIKLPDFALGASRNRERDQRYIIVSSRQRKRTFKAQWRKKNAHACMKLLPFGKHASQDFRFLNVTFCNRATFDYHSDLIG